MQTPFTLAKKKSATDTATPGLKKKGQDKDQDSVTKCSAPPQDCRLQIISSKLNLHLLSQPSAAGFMSLVHGERNVGV